MEGWTISSYRNARARQTDGRIYSHDTSHIEMQGRILKTRPDTRASIASRKAKSARTDEPRDTPSYRVASSRLKSRYCIMPKPLHCCLLLSFSSPLPPLPPPRSSSTISFSTLIIDFSFFQRFFPFRSSIYIFLRAIRNSASANARSWPQRKMTNARTMGLTHKPIQ